MERSVEGWVQAALGLFEAEWDELIGKPSSVSADADAQACATITHVRRRVFGWWLDWG